jgi:hypothetical protein
MPNILVPVDTEIEVNVEVNDFLDTCDSSDIEEIVEYLIEEGHINKFAVNDYYYTDQSVTESQFEDALKKLQGNWNRLSSDDEAAILKIANQF